MYNSNNKRHHSPSFRNVTCMHSSKERFPIVAVHDLTIPNADSDSGFGSSLQTKIHPCSRKENFYQRSLMRSNSLSQLQMNDDRNAQNTEILNNSFSAFESADPIMKELKECLAESENRRATLIQKLKEAQGTLQLQSDRLTKIEVTSKGNNSMLNELKKKESDYKKRLSELEKTKHEKSKLQRENKRLRHEMQTRIENLHSQLKNLQSQHQLCDSEGEKRLKLLEHSSKTIKILEDENYKLLRENGAGKTEIDIYKESLRLLKQRCSLLEEKNNCLNEDVSKLHEEKQDLQSCLDQNEKQLIEESEQAQLFQKENQHLANGWKNLSDEKDLVKEQLEQCEQSLAEEQSQFLSLSLEKDTLKHQFKETEVRNKLLKNDIESLTQDNFRLQDQLNALQHELTTDKLTISNLEENKRKLEEELSAVKKVCEELSGELCSVKSSYEQVLEQVGDLGKERSQFTQKRHVLEQENKHLEQNISQMKENLEEKNKYYRSEKKNFEETIHQLKEGIKYNDKVISQQKDKYTELEQKLQKTVDELTASSMVQKDELAGWKNTCERLTGALNRKEKEIQSLADKCGDLEDVEEGQRIYQPKHHFITNNQEVTLQLKVEVQDYQDQINKIHRLKEENRRLLQEKQENEQMIKLLETEKEVLSINAKRDLDNCQREYSKMELDMDSQKQMVADLQQTNEFLAEKVEICEKENEELKETLTKETEISTDEQNGLKNTYDVLYDEHSELKKEYDNLLERHECFMSDFNNDSTIPDKEMNVISKEKEGLERQIDLLNGQISLIEGSKKRSEETIKKMEGELMKIKAENESLKTNCQNETLTDDGEPHAYQTELDQIKQELLETKQDLQKQQDAYKLLKQEHEEERQNKPTYIEESLADVDHDLQQMRQELHKLMGVIEIKDEEIINLGMQLKTAQTQLYHQEEALKQMKETVMKIEKKSVSNLNSEKASLTASSNDGIPSKQNGDHSDGQPAEQVAQQFPGVTLRSSSMVETLSSVDETAKTGDSSSMPNDERLQSLIAKYRNPSDQPNSPEKNRVMGRPHSVGPGSSFSGMSRILGLTTPKPFYLSSGGSKFNRFSGSSLSSGISAISPSSPPPPAAGNVSPAPITTAPAPTITPSVPLSTDASSVVRSPSPSRTVSSPVNTNEDVPKASPMKVGASNRPPVPPPRPASRPASARNSDIESPVNGVMSPPSPASTIEDTTVVDATEEVDANMIITI